MRWLCVLLSFVMTLSTWNNLQAQQVFPPGTFSIDGVRIACGPLNFVIVDGLPDVGINDGQGNILLNPRIMTALPTALKLYWAAHECGHFFVGADEVAADCWAISTGKRQGWFPVEAFQQLEQMFRNNPGDVRHPTGPERVRRMIDCYQSS